ncbi:ABC transporter substrate-binding protein [Nocardioides rubriscoriae]|uniref:ABC transporter substrate-binding protein n=1 Tax=Nocardioides rubriscoriae TaxID=642762 RepID=UPI0011DF8624|nr:ABC transporter substrate-binding protein [Nocardioides rubriscoriae]
MRLNKPLVGLTVASLLALAACGGSSDSNSSDEPTVNVSELAGGGQDATATGPLTIDGAKKGGTVHVIGTSADMTTTLDPRGIYYSDMISIAGSFLVRSLTQWKYDEKTKNMVLVPDLATDLGTSNDDFTEWTFKLKPGIKYEDGKTISSKDIAYSVSSSLDCNTFTDCPSNYLLGTLTGSGDVKKDGDIASGIETPDDETIIFKFDKPFPDMSYYSFFPLFSPIPPAVGKDIANYPSKLVSTGPYKIAEFTPAKSLKLVRNDQWDPATDPARAALPDEWDFDTSYSDPKKVDAIVLASKGEGATTMSYDDIDSSDIPTFRSQAGDRIATGSTPLTRWLAPDNTKVPLEVRQALTYAYPYDAAAKTAGLIKDINYIPTTTLMAPGVPGREVVNGLPDHSAAQTDPAKAKQILEDAGKLGFEVSWLYSTDDPLSVKTMEVVKAAYEKAGFTAKPFATTTTDAAEKRASVDTPINIRVGGWFSDWPSGYSWIPPVFAPPEAGKPCAEQKWETFGVVNFAHFCEDDVNAEIDRVKGLPIDEQPAAWTALEKMIQEKYYPIIPTSNGGTIQGHGTALEGVNIDITGGLPTFKTIWVNQ